MTIELLGVHPVDSAEPCYLIEMQIAPWDESFDWEEVTQEADDQPRSNWQVAYDETPLDDAQTRWAFFFHYLDLSKPLLTPAGPCKLPAPTPLPAHLKHIQYLQP